MSKFKMLIASSQWLMALSHNLVHHLHNFLSAFHSLFVSIVAAIPEHETAEAVMHLFDECFAAEIVDDGQQADNE